VCATGGLTQKQSLRGLLLRHLNERSWGRELSLCLVDRVVFLVEARGDFKSRRFCSLHAAFGPEGALSLS